MSSPLKTPLALDHIATRCIMRDLLALTFSLEVFYKAFHYFRTDDSEAIAENVRLQALQECPMGHVVQLETIVYPKHNDLEEL